ncbi:MAG: hypothetical protein PHI88_00840 [Candidatus Pacebacteria bacterium]|nr:hypothetical protein [Candidatus Paceibacterota bacterium]
MEEETPQAEPKKEGGDNMIAILSYIGILFLVPLLAAKDNEFAKYHAKQGLVLFIAEVATALIAWIPFIGWVVGLVAWITWLVLSIIGIVNVVGGKKKPLPIIGSLADKFKI